MPGGGRLTIATANVPHDDRNKPAELAAGDYVSVSVSDTGTGMTDEVLRKAFEPFFTTKPVGRGTGLGLSQVYGIVKQTGGTVSIATKPGEGTTVTVFLPRTTALPVMRGSDDFQNVPLPRRMATILVVDDDQDVRRLAVSCLESLGYRVLAADSGLAALEIVATGARLDMVLIDIAMPEINGVESIEAILKGMSDASLLVHDGLCQPDKTRSFRTARAKKAFHARRTCRKSRRNTISD